ncbi:MAG: sulfite exporter TauE/SafE family protein, partial [Pseudomonadota bacterium]
PPVELLAICWCLEVGASLIMVRGGLREADMSTVVPLVLGSSLALPFGVWLTHSLPIETSKLVALSLIVALALSQLAKLRLSFLATKPGTFGAGALAGTATGLAGVGGMVIALYVLAREAPARQMRANLVMFLAISSAITFFTYLAYGMFTTETILRGLLLVGPAILGVIAGSRLFLPKLEPYYRPFCLSLLVALASLSIVRTAL